MKDNELILPEEIRALRSRSGAGQRAFADIFGVSHVAVGRWERGEREPDPPQRLALLQFGKMLDANGVEQKRADQDDRTKRLAAELVEELAEAPLLTVYQRLFGGGSDSSASTHSP